MYYKLAFYNIKEILYQYSELTEACVGESSGVPNRLSSRKRDDLFVRTLYVGGVSDATELVVVVLETDAALDLVITCDGD